MKKYSLNVKTFVSSVIVLGALTISSCNQVKCNEPKDDNYESTTNNCNEDQTSGKFVRSNKTMLINGSDSNGHYLITIQQATEDYKIDLITNWGLTTSGGGSVSAVSHTCSVSQNTATFPATNIAGGTAAGTITYNPGTQKVSIQVTLSGFGSGIDGSSNDTEQ
jgi:hypothetical protein